MLQDVGEDRGVAQWRQSSTDATRTRRTGRGDHCLAAALSRSQASNPGGYRP